MSPSAWSYQSITGLPPALNLPVPIYTPGCNNNNNNNKRVFKKILFQQAPTINHTTFSRSFKEWKFLQYELDCLQGLDWMKCPSCSIFQHSCHVNFIVSRHQEGSYLLHIVPYYVWILCYNEGMGERTTWSHKGLSLFGL